MAGRTPIDDAEARARHHHVGPHAAERSGRDSPVLLAGIAAGRRDCRAARQSSSGALGSLRRWTSRQITRSCCNKCADSGRSRRCASLRRSALSARRTAAGGRWTIPSGPSRPIGHIAPWEGRRRRLWGSSGLRVLSGFPHIRSPRVYADTLRYADHPTNSTGPPVAELGRSLQSTMLWRWQFLSP
jgi:hypothetical protein